MADNQETEANSGPGVMGLVKAIAFVSVLVVVEMVVAAMVIPSATDTEALARELARAAEGDEFGDDAAEDLAAIDTREATSEVNIGTFNITRFDPDSDKTMNVDFVVLGVVLADEEADFLAAFEASRGRIEEQVVMTMHGANTSDLSSAGLGLIKRQILEKTNRALGRPLLREVIFTKINFVER